jgi:hypothetical protein
MSTTAESGVDEKDRVHPVEHTSPPAPGDDGYNPNDSGTPGPRQPDPEPVPAPKGN